MKIPSTLKTLAFLAALAGCLVAVNPLCAEIPRLEQRGEATQLMVDDRPYLVLGGELHNSSASSLEYVAPIFPQLKEAQLNTVLAVVSWAQFEPEEGKFDTSLLDGLVELARANDLKLVLLWFGCWKNGQSHYLPEWVKADYDRFPRVRTESGHALEIVSPLSDEALQADTRAFRHFMHRLREVDGEENTVLMIQVQNEMGVLGATRDHSPMADELFAADVPDGLMDYLLDHREELLPELREVWKANGFAGSGSWGEVFGNGPAADEIFMAWHYARFIDHMAQTGKEAYPLPMFVNAWIVQPQDEKPGDYPSGGPQAHVHDVWRAGAPHIDILAPDIYLPEFAEICRQYSRSGNPLFIPETRGGSTGAANAFYAFAANNAIGFSPFGIDSRIHREGAEALVLAYDLLGQLSEQILLAQQDGRIDGTALDSGRPARTIELAGYRLRLELRSGWGVREVPESGYGLVISTGPDEFLVAGSNIQVSFSALTEGPAVTGLASVIEGEFVDGDWIPGRKLNGDAIMLDYDLGALARQNRTGTGLKFGPEPSILKVRLYRYE